MGFPRDGRWQAVGVALLVWMWSVPGVHLASGQGLSGTPETALVVDGSVKNVFQAGDQHLVQILVQRSEAPRLDAVAGVRYPAPGEYVYAHVNEAGSFLGRFASGKLPTVEMQIRASLALGESGQWQAVAGDWYQENAAGGIGGRPGSAPDDGPTLGITSRVQSIGRESVLRVLQVAPGSPAAAAGIEAGDVLVEANSAPLRSQQQLDEAYRNSGGKFSLTVRDVRSGRDVRVEVGGVPNSPLAGSAGGSVQPLGTTTELAFYSGEAAVKVTAVAPNSPAHKAGLTPGLLILKANGKTIGSPKELDQVEQASPGPLELVVVDPADKRERVVRISR